MTIKNDFGNRFEGWIDFDIDQDFLSWVMKIKFSKPVISINIRFTASLPAGDTGPPEASALLMNMGNDDWSVSCPHNSAKSKYNYDCVLMESIMFYEAQRSGKLPHNNRIPWRGDSALDDHGDNGEDLSGGWYDAGDYVKFNFPMAWATVMLEWGLLEFKDAYEASGQLDWISFNITDEMCWGSLWLYKATKESKYLDEAKKHYDSSPDWGMSWDDVIIGNQILMYELTGEERYKQDIEGTFHGWFPGGANMAAAALIAAEHGVNPDEYRHWAMCQIHYALGDAGHSFVVGFGKNPPTQPHHRSSSCPKPPGICNMNVLHIDVPNVHTLYGALVGGPDGSDGYKDSRNNYVNNEVACDYNAGFQTAVAGDEQINPHITAFIEELPDGGTNQGAQSKYNYDCVLMESIMFYEAQRSGKLPDNNRIPWRGDSALDDHGLNGEDLSGGWYDAGDYVKFNFPMAWATVVLEWGLLEFKDAYEASGQLDWMYECVKWPLDYLLKCHVADDVLYAQVGDGGKDHGSWGRPEDMTMQRPAFKIDASNPGSDLAMETAAAFAAGSMVFKERTSSRQLSFFFIDATYAATLLEHAKTLWDFAIQHQGKYSSSVSAAAGYYSSATGEQKYLDEAKKWFDPSPDWGMSWDDVIIGNQILMYNLTGEELYKQAVEGTFTDCSCPNPPGICNMNVLHIDVPNVHTLYGALVGGPDGSDGYKDSRNNYVNNEVANDYNAGFQTAVAALVLANVETDPNNHWSGAFQAKPCFNINKDITSWTLHLQFEQPVASIECWTAVVKSTNADKTEYILTNQPYNGVQHVGDELCIDFIGHEMSSKYNYDCVLMESIMFYAAQRSGKLPADNPIPWRDDSALDDHGDNGEDLSGGWYDAGDHVKFNFPMAYTTVVLNWGLLEFKDAYVDSGLLDEMSGMETETTVTGDRQRK
nr:hypothetical protein BaRGS_004518 [Batillaria attramentaria]